MDQENKNKRKITPSKKRYLSVLLFLVLAIIIFNLSHGISYAGLFTDTTDQVIRGGLGPALTVLASPFFLAINMLLYVIFAFAGLILIIAGILMDWAINPNNFTAVMSMHSIADGWTIVRDFLNLMFILVLLFSAFCTIFQVEKYHLKKILLTLVLMALLVNFSFPISRFVIDTANVTMYFIINRAFPDLSNSSGISTSIVQFSKIVYAVAPSAGFLGYKTLGYSFTIKMVSAILFLFLLGATLLIIAILLIIRIVVLAIVVIFSPVGFVGAILPQFKRFSDMWWDTLFKQSFFGVIMAFMLYLSLKMMEEMQASGGIMESIRQFVSENMGGQSNYSGILVTGTQMAIPIALLWIGLIAAQKMGAAGAQWAQKKVMGGMSAVTGLSWLKRTKDAYAARRKEAQATSASNRLGKWLGGQQDRFRSGVPVGREARYAGLRYQQDQVKRRDEEAKLHDTEHLSEAELQTLATSGDQFERAAAIMELAARKLADNAQLNDIRRLFGSESQVVRGLEDKMINYNPQAVARDVNGNYNEARALEAARSGKIKIDDLSADALSDNDLMRSLALNGYIKVEDWEKLRGKSDFHREALQMSLTHIANMRDGAGNYVYNDMTNANHRAIQLANIQQNRHGSNAINAGNVEALLTYSNAEIMKRTDNWILGYADQLGNVKNSSQLGDVVANIGDRAVAHNLAQHYRDNETSPHYEYFTNNPRMRGA
jgi:hypothetical protein